MTPIAAIDAHVDSDDTPFAKLMEVTPDLAAKWLGRNIRNRAKNKRNIMLWSTAMSNGRWLVNGETIKLSPKSELLDGQNRCEACLLSETPFWSIVAFNISPKAFDTIDIGRKRTGGDILAIEKCRNYNATASAIRWINAVENKFHDPGFVTLEPYQIREIWEARRSIEDSVAETVFIKGTMPLSIAGALHYLFLQKTEKSEVAKFFADLQSGANLGVYDSVLVLRERLLRNNLEQKQKKKLPRAEIAALVIRAWNHRREGKQATRTLKGLIQTKTGPKLPDII